MRILQINKFFFEKGGTERYLFGVSRALQARGHHVAFFSMHHPDNLDSEYATFFVRERDYSSGGRSLDKIPTGFSFIRSREAAEKLSDLIATFRPDVAHLHNIYHQITPSILPVLAEAGVPAVMTLHDYKLICPNYSLYDGHAYCFRCRGGRFYHAPWVRCSGGSFVKSTLLAIEAYYQKASHVYDSIRLFLSPSRYLRDTYVRDGFAEQRILYLPAFVAPRNVGTGAVEANDVSGLPETYALYFGRLSREKGLRTLLEATEHARDIPLVLSGDGPLRGELERAAAARGANVHFTGYLQGAALDGVVQRARLAVLPSESPENAPFTALEAMAAGVPLVASRIGGLPELVERVGGRLFAPGDAGDLAAAMTELWNDAEALRHVGEQSRRVIETDFSEATHVAALTTVYERAIAGGTKP